MEYQNLSDYNGSLGSKPQRNGYGGVEYDWEVPDGQVIGTPGGVSSIQHHYTKGFNGRGNNSSDIYGMSNPRYDSGLYGGLYEVGGSAGEAQGYYPPTAYAVGGGSDVAGGEWWARRTVHPHVGPPGVPEGGHSDAVDETTVSTTATTRLEDLTKEPPSKKKVRL